MKQDFDYTNYPILITGVAKSGTTLLQSLIDGHKKLIVIPGEPSFFRLLNREYPNNHRIVRDWLKCYSVPGVTKNLLLNKLFNEGYDYVSKYRDFRKIDLSKIKEDDFKPKISGLEDDYQIFDYDLYFKFMEKELEEIKNKKDIMIAAIKAVSVALKTRIKNDILKYWAYKDTFNSKKIKLFFNLFPEGKVLFIIRNVRAWFNSRKQYHLSKKQFPKNIPNILYLYQWIETYKKSYYAIIDIMKQYGNEKIYFVKYENIVKNVRKEIDKVLIFLNLPPDELCYKPTTFGVPVNVSTSPKEIDGKKVFKHSLNKWQQELSLRDKIYLNLFLIKSHLLNLVFKIFMNVLELIYNVKNRRISKKELFSVSKVFQQITKD